MSSTATPGEIFVPRRPSGAGTRLVTDGRVTRQVRIIGYLGPDYEVFDIQTGGHGEIYFCVSAGGEDPPMAFVGKRAPRQVLLDPVRRRAFLRECLLAVRLSALPGFADCHILRIDGLPVLMTAAVLRGDDGVVNLRDVVDGPARPVPVMAFLAWAVATSMSVAARAHPGLVHGDLKPENILVQAGAPLITDLGLAGTLRHGWGPDTLPGTPRYLAPEARHPSARLTGATDIYAFGVILRELLDNCRVPDSGTAFDLITELAARCTADDPDRRPADFQEVAEHLAPSFESSDPAVEKRYQLYQLLAVMGMSNAVVLPDFESLARLEEWDLLRETIETRPAAQRPGKAWHMHGLALTRTGRDDEALKSFLRALACVQWESEDNGRALWYGPDEDAVRSIRYDIAVLLVNMERFDEAETLGGELVAEAASDEAARRAASIVAMALIQSGRLVDGEQMLLRSMMGERDHERLAEGFKARADLRLLQGRPGDAIEALQQAVQLVPGRAAYHRWLGRLLARLGQPGLAVAAFDHAMLCGDLSEPVLAIRLACAIVAGRTNPDLYRAEAERQFGAERVEEAWAGVLHILGNGYEGDPAEPAAPPATEPAAPPATGPVGRALDFGELQVEVGGTGFYTFDYYTDGEPELIGDFLRRYREMATLIASATMRGAPVVATRCDGCATVILTNRAVDTSFACVRCAAVHHVSPLRDGPHRELQDAVGRALQMTEEPADDQARFVTVQATEPATEEQTRQVHEAARRHGLEPSPPDHAAVLLAHMRGLSTGHFALHHPPIGAIYRFPPGGRHIPRMAPAPVEDYLAEVRGIFAGPVNSSSAAIDYTRDDLDSLIWANRLDEATARAYADPDVTSGGAALVLLSQLRLNRGEPKIALRLADEAVQLDSDAENAWVAKGYAETMCGDLAAARASLSEALRVNTASSGAVALQATIEQLSGDDNAPATLARAITLGSILPPSD